MPIVDEVASQLKQAMRDQDKPRLQALRNIRAAFLEALKVEGAPDALPDTEAEGILRRLAKQRRESIEAYDAGNRDDLAASERAELAVVESFLPQLADQRQTETWVTEAIAATGASGPGDLGRVMGHLMKHHKDQLDGKLANQIARRALS
jgi:uncharacterized protein